MKPSLLVVELWGLGDLVIAAPFLRAAAEQFTVSLLAKPYARDLQARFWPGVRVVPFVAPWTSFHRKYYLWNWPWRSIVGLRHLRRERFEVGLSARWDPRDHLLLRLLGPKRRLGYPRLRSQVFLTDALAKPEPAAHRYENWRILGEALGLKLSPPLLPAVAGPPLGRRGNPGPLRGGATGASLAVGALPRDCLPPSPGGLPSSPSLVIPTRPEWWNKAGEPTIEVPRTVTELLGLVDRAAVFVGNDSGPAHLAACLRRAYLHSFRSPTLRVVRSVASGRPGAGGQTLPV